VRFSTRRAVVGICVAAFVAGCANSTTDLLSEADLRPITTVRPTTRGWNWPAKPTRERRLAEGCEGWRWQDEEKLGVTTGCLFDSTTAAKEGLPRAQAYARLWAQRTVAQNGGKFTDIRLDKPGEQTWLIQGNDFPGGPQLTLGWRRANLMLQIHIQCIWRYCVSDIRSAARAWVDAIDDEARAHQ